MQIRLARRSAAENEYWHWVKNTRRLLRNVADGRKPATGPCFRDGPSIEVLPRHKAWALRAVAEEEFSWATDYGFIKLTGQCGLPESDTGKTEKN
jgi:hypothetical protein